MYSHDDTNGLVKERYAPPETRCEPGFVEEDPDDDEDEVEHDQPVGLLAQLVLPARALGGRSAGIDQVLDGDHSQQQGLHQHGATKACVDLETDTFHPFVDKVQM